MVRDLASKWGDWHWYAEQFRYIRQSAPEQYPWDQIHWELWLRASNTFRKPQPPNNKSRFLSQFFPKGTCWAFQASKHCYRCKFEHVCFKCGGKHPGGSAQLRRQKVDSLSVQKANETVIKYLVLHGKPVTPVRVDRLDFLLHGYDRFLKTFLVDGFRFGFHIHFVSERFSSESPNVKSALDQPAVTHAKLHKECDARRIVGPFTAPPFPNCRCSPLGIVPKKDPSEFRLIHHLSYPKGSSVNDFIPDYCSTVKYASVGDAVKLLKRLEKGFLWPKPT